MNDDLPPAPLDAEERQRHMDWIDMCVAADKNDDRGYDDWLLANADDPLSGGLGVPAEPTEEGDDDAPVRTDD